MAATNKSKVVKVTKTVTTKTTVKKTPVKKKVVPLVKTNHVVLILDESSSMGAIVNPVKKSLDTLLSDLRKESAANGIKTTFSFVRFNQSAKIDRQCVDINSVSNLDFWPSGMTALWDGVHLGLQILEGAKEDSKLLIVVTDGEENSSRLTTGPALFRRMVDLVHQGDYTFTFQVPNENAKRLLVGGGISTDNILVWEQTETGVQQADFARTSGLQQYFNANSQGIRSVQSFYHVDTDLSTLKKTDVSKKLNDITGQLKILTVNEEKPIREFVEGKNVHFVIGGAYYQLTKPEKVQKHKDIILYNKEEKKYYGGSKCRELIGLPDDGDAKVSPLDHGKWEIFVASTSVNRKVVRGTKLLINKNKTSDDAPTWDHTKV
jgi:hypothetical protein